MTSIVSSWTATAVAVAVAYQILVKAVPEPEVYRLLRKHCGAQSIQRFDLKSTIHSLIIGVAATCSILWDAFFTEVHEPARMYMCMPPTTWLSWALPPIEAGYALGELFTMIPQRNWQYIAHGTLVLSTLSVLRWLGVVAHASRILVIHVSTAFLNLRGIDLGPRVNGAIDVCFAMSFILLRLVILPVWWVQFLAYGYGLKGDGGAGGGGGSVDVRATASCVTNAVYRVVVVGGVLIHGLNLYWGLLVCKKLWQKLRGRSALHRSKAGSNG